MNGEKIIPNVGDIIVVESNDKHIVTNNTDQDFLYMAFKINYDEKDCYWDLVENGWNSSKTIPTTKATTSKAPLW